MKSQKNHELICFHGINSDPGYYVYDTYRPIKRVLIPFHLIFRGEVKEEYVLKLKKTKEQIMIDSGAAYYYLNTAKGYPKDYLNAYIEFLERVQPDYAFALDFCFERRKMRTDELLEANNHSQMNSFDKAKEQGLELNLVVQGWDSISYQESAKFIRKNLRKTKEGYYGIGSVCRSKKERVDQVIQWVSEILPPEQGHCFGQTQRTIKILRKHKLRSVDTANATSNAGRSVYCDPYGQWFYSLNSKQGKRKHMFKKSDFENNPAYYNFLFKINVDAIEIACTGREPKGWMHPITKTTKLKRFIDKK